MAERLQKLLSAYGIASRRTAEAMILAGRVTVNGAPAVLGQRADPMLDLICIDGEPLAEKQPRLYILLNKPRGFVTTLHDENGRRSVAELVADCGARVYPVGRLDMYSEGLLLLTNDGEWAARLEHPGSEVDKTYLAWVNGWHDAALSMLRGPMELDGVPLRPAKVLLRGQTGGAMLLEITIHEGKNRQIRRMCETSGLRVTRLRRISEGALRLGDLPIGAWRKLLPEEVALLREI